MTIWCQNDCLKLSMTDHETWSLFLGGGGWGCEYNTRGDKHFAKTAFNFS